MPADDPLNRTSGESASSLDSKNHDTQTRSDFGEVFESGSTLGNRYRILQLLGAGGMGRVYLAHDNELDVDVAIKVMRPELMQNEQTVDRLKNELLLARKISHRNIVRIHDIGEIAGLKYLSMTYLGGSSLKEVMKNTGRIPTTRAVHMINQISEGIAAAHQEGVIHRDLKPANIIVDEKDRVCITDFGIAQSLETSDMTQSGVLIGTPAYFSPEQARAERVDARSDIYGIGLIAYQILTGELPAEAGEGRFPVASRVERNLRKNVPDVPNYLVKIVAKCLDPDVSGRYSTVESIVRDLERKKVPRTFLEQFRMRRLKPTLLIAVLILLTVAGIFVWQTQTNREPLPPTAQPAHSIVVLPFLNKTGHEELAWTESGISDLLITDLTHAGNLRVVDPDRVFQTLKDLKITSGTYEADVLQKITDILDADYVIEGSLRQAGSLLRADLRLIDMHNPNHPVVFNVTGNKQEDLFKMSTNLAAQVHRQLQLKPSPSNWNPETFNYPVEALKSFQQGVEALRKGNYQPAILFFQDSVQRAPDFSRAYMKLSEANLKSGNEEQAIAVLIRGLSHSKNEKDKLMMNAQKAFLEGDLDQTIELYQNLLKSHSADSEIQFRLAEAFEEKGDLKNAVLSLEKVIRLDPHNPQAYFHLGKDTVLMGEAEKGITQYLTKALSIQTQLDNLDGQADALNAMGVGYERLGRYDDATRYYQNAFSLREKVGNRKGAATSLSNLAKIYVFQGDVPKAQEILNRTLVIFEELEDQQGISNIVNLFGVLNEDQGNFAEALRNYKKALQIRKQIGNDRLTAQSYDNVGQIYYLTGQFDDAEVFWRQSLELRKKIGEESGVILSLQNMGFLEFAQAKLDLALKSFLEALEKSRAIQYENAIAVSLGNLGTIYQYQGRYAAALDSYQEAIDVLNRLKDKKGVAEYTKLMGAAFLDLNSLKAAREKFEEAAKLAKELGSTDLETDLQILLSRLHRMEGDLRAAENEVQKSLTNAQRQNYDKALFDAKIEKALLLSAAGNNSEGLRRLSELLAKSQEMGDVWRKIDCYYALASLYSKNTQFRFTIQYAEDAIELAQKIGLKPYLYKLHALEGNAYMNLKDTTKARDNFRRASAYFDEIKRSVPKGSLADLMNQKEFVQLDEGLRKLEGVHPQS